MCFDISFPLAPLFRAVSVNDRLHIYTSELASFITDGRKYEKPGSETNTRLTYNIAGCVCSHQCTSPYKSYVSK